MEAPLNVTKTIYTVTDFLQWQRAGQLNLRPYFQRGDVWTPKAKSFLIDTLLRGYSVPIIYLQNKPDRETLSNVRLVVDGQQRLRTIIGFIDPGALRDYGERDSFTLLRAHNPQFARATFEDLPPEAKDRILQTELSVHILPQTLSNAHLLQLFARLNSTGERLNDQELRNAEFHGAFKAVAYAQTYKQIERWQDWSIFTPRAIAQMRDAELMSELMIASMRGVQNKSKKQIDDIYRLYDDEFEDSSVVAGRVSATFDALDELYRFVEPSRAANMNTSSWFYTFFIATDIALHGMPIHRYDFQNQAIEVEQEATTKSLGHIIRNVRRVQELLMRDEVPRGVAKALRGASSDLGSRATRLDFLLTR